MKKIIRTIFVTTLAMAMAIAATACSSSKTAEPKQGQKQVLNIFTWEGYVPSEVVSDFEAATGIQVNYSNFSTNEEMLSKIQAQKGQYDIIICSDYIIDNMRSEGRILQEIDWSRLANAANIDANYQGKYYDPDNKLTIPYASACAILVYDTAKVDTPVTKYADLWNPALADKLVLLDGDRDIIGLTLLKLGYSVNETDPARLAEAKEELLALKPNVAVFDANTPHNALINGDAVAGYMFGSQATAAMAEVSTLDFAYAEEGMMQYIDNIVVPEGAPNPDSAYAFMDYILDGEVSAKISALINYPNCNTAAKAFLPQEYLDNLTVNIPVEALQKAQMIAPIGNAAVTYNEIWTEFKSH